MAAFNAIKLPLLFGLVLLSLSSAPVAQGQYDDDLDLDELLPLVEALMNDTVRNKGMQCGCVCVCVYREKSRVE